MKIRFVIFILFLFTIALFSFFWWQQAIVPADSHDSSYKLFVVNRGDDARTIAKNLQKEGLIRDPIAFFLLVRFGGIGQNIQSGEFRLSASGDLRTIATNLTHGTSDVWVTIPEGWRNEEIALRLTETLGIPEAEFLRYAKEGYMFPDTYLLPKDATAAASADMFLANFHKKVTSSLIDRAIKRGIDANDLITIASLVEREAKYPDDRPVVASVILNRLKQGMKLDIDATVQYALGYEPVSKSWWKKDLTIDDLAIRSPYNTYKNSGLPPTPISNPGLAAIEAVAEAPNTNYLYYVSDSKGRIHPAATVEDHNANVRKYIPQ